MVELEGAIATKGKELQEQASVIMQNDANTHCLSEARVDANFRWKQLEMKVQGLEVAAKYEPCFLL